MYHIFDSVSREFPFLWLASYSLTPGLDSLHEDFFHIASSTPESPVNSSLDYRASSQEVPAIFHRGGGRRGGIRLGSGSLQDLSLLTMNYSNVPKSPLNAHSSLTRRSSRSSVGTSSSRIRHLSGSLSSSALLRSTCPELDSDEMNTVGESSTSNGPDVGQERVHSLVYRQYRPSYDLSTPPSSPSTVNGNTPEEVISANILAPRPDYIPVESMTPYNTNHTDGNIRWYD